MRDVCALVHDAGGQVYVDGANLNALVGLAQPGRFGADVSHLNLHKTFCIPHGGGGPGVGPVGVRAHLAPYLPNHPLVAEAGPATGVGPVSAAPWGSAGILPISWAYVRLMGADGLTAGDRSRRCCLRTTSLHRLARALPGAVHRRDGLVAHECILDLREITKQTGVTVDDVAKRLIDYGFHAPTMSFPVAGTLMVEPTESEGLARDRAVLRRHDRDPRVRSTGWRPVNGRSRTSPLRGAPHTAASVTGEWTAKYSRELAVYPAPVDPAGQVLATGAPDRRRVRRPQPGLLMPAGRGICRGRGLRTPPQELEGRGTARQVPGCWCACRARRRYRSAGAPLPAGGDH